MNELVLKLTKFALQLNQEGDRTMSSYFRNNVIPEIENMQVRINQLQTERNVIVHNKRVNDAIQTALERDELIISHSGFMEFLESKDKFG